MPPESLKWDSEMTMRSELPFCTIDLAFREFCLSSKVNYHNNRANLHLFPVLALKTTLSHGKIASGHLFVTSSESKAPVKTF